jgi:hypothetical protein
METYMMAKINCSRCGRGTHRTPHDDETWETALRVQLSPSIASFRDLVRTAFQEDPPAATCNRCKTVEPRTAEWKIVRSPEVLIIAINQVDPWQAVKPGLQVPTIPEELDLAEFLHDSAGTTARYRLTGVVNHVGKQLIVGHYVSHVRHPSGSWYLLDDNAVSPSSVAMLQAYDPSQGASQMIPTLVAYVKIHEGEDINALATRAAYPQPAPRAFLHPQIVYDNSMTLEKLKGLCKNHGLTPGNVKKVESLWRIIDAANSADSDFTMRLKDWLITTLLSTGQVAVDAEKTQKQLAKQLKAFMKTQAALPQTPARTSGTGGVASTGTQTALDSTQVALDAANARIAQLEKTVADLQRRPQGHGSRPSSQSSPRGSSPRSVTTNKILELIQQLPKSPEPARGTKRPASDAADRSPETQKRRAIQLAAQACAAIDAGAQLAPAPPVDDHRHSNAENQRPSRSRSGPRLGGSPHLTTHGRCHRCPTIAGEIHHKHAQVCGWWVPGTRVSPQSIPSDVVREADNFLDNLGDELDRDQYAGVSFRDNTSVVEDGDETRDFLHDYEEEPAQGNPPVRSPPRSAATGRGARTPPAAGGHHDNAIFIEDGDETQDFLNEDGEAIRNPAGEPWRHSRSNSDPSDWAPAQSVPSGTGARTSPQLRSTPPAKSPARSVANGSAATKSASPRIKVERKSPSPRTRVERKTPSPRIKVERKSPVAPLDDNAAVVEDREAIPNPEGEPWRHSRSNSDPSDWAPPAQSAPSGNGTRISPAAGHNDNVIVIEDDGEEIPNPEGEQWRYSRSNSDSQEWAPARSAASGNVARTSPGGNGVRTSPNGNGTRTSPRARMSPGTVQRAARDLLRQLEESGR